MRKLSSILVITTLMVSYAFANSNEGRERGGRGIMKQLDLSKEQMSKLKEYRSENKENNKEVKEQLKTLKDELKTKFIAQASDSELEAIHKKISKLRIKMSDHKFSKMLALKSILTKEQREKFMEMKKPRRPRGKKE